MMFLSLLFASQMIRLIPFLCNLFLSPAKEFFCSLYSSDLIQQLSFCPNFAYSTFLSKRLRNTRALELVFYRINKLANSEVRW
jgi:hypothetical protein